MRSLRNILFLFAAVSAGATEITYTNLAQMMQARSNQVPASATVLLLGRTTPGDGGGGTFIKSTSSETNNFTRYAMVGGGTFVRQTDYITPEMGGAVGDGVTDNYAIMNQWANLTGYVKRLMPFRVYRVVGELAATNNNTVIEGNYGEILLDTSSDNRASFRTWGLTGLNQWTNTHPTGSTNLTMRHTILRAGNLSTGGAWGSSTAGKNLAYIVGVDGVLIENCHFYGSASTYWALAIKSKNVRVTGCIIDNQGDVFHDGVHFEGGQYFTIFGNLIKSGDTSIAIGSDWNSHIEHGVVAANQTLTTHGYSYHLFTTFRADPVSGALPDSRTRFIEVVGGPARGGQIRNSSIRFDDGGWAFYGTNFPATSPPGRLSDISVSDITIEEPASSTNKTQLISAIYIVGGQRIKLNSIQIPSPYFGALTINGTKDLDIVDCDFGQPQYAARPTVNWQASVVIPGGTNVLQLTSERIRIHQTRIHNRPDVAVGGIRPFNINDLKITASDIFMDGTNATPAIDLGPSVTNVTIALNNFHSQAGSTNPAILLGGLAGDANIIAENTFASTITGGSHSGARTRGIWSEASGRSHWHVGDLKVNLTTDGVQVSGMTNPGTMGASSGIFNVERDSPAILWSWGRGGNGNVYYQVTGGRAAILTPSGRIIYSNTNSDSSDKEFAIGPFNWDTDVLPFYTFGSSSRASGNVALIGGGSDLGTAANQVLFYIAPNSAITNLRGSNIMVVQTPASSNVTGLLLRDGLDGPLWTVSRQNGFVTDGTAVINTGTISSIGISAPSDVFDVSGSPLTSNGTITLTFDSQATNQVFAAPADGTNGVPAFRLLSGYHLFSGVEAGTNTVITINPSNGKLQIHTPGGSGGTGSVTNVGLSLPASVFDISGSPVTADGVLTATFDNQAQNTAWMGGTNGSGAPFFRKITGLDLLEALEPSGTVTFTTNNFKIQIIGASGGAASGTWVNAAQVVNPNFQDGTRFVFSVASGTNVTVNLKDSTDWGDFSIQSGLAQLDTGVVGPTELASTAVSAGTYTNAIFTVDADGRLTAAESRPLVITGIPAFSIINSSHITWTTNGTTNWIAQIPTGAIGATELASTAVTPGTYTLTDITVDADGRITAIANGSVPGGNGFDVFGTFRMAITNLAVPMAPDIVAPDESTIEVTGGIDSDINGPYTWFDNDANSDVMEINFTAPRADNKYWVLIDVWADNTTAGADMEAHIYEKTTTGFKWSYTSETGGFAKGGFVDIAVLELP